MSFQTLALTPEQCFSVLDFIRISPTLLEQKSRAKTSIKIWFFFEMNNLMSFQTLHVICHSLQPYKWFEAILSTIWSFSLFWPNFEGSYKEIHRNFCPSRWLEVLFDKFVIHCNPTRDLRPFCQQSDFSFFSGQVWRILTKKFIIIFALAGGLKFCLTTLSFPATLNVIWGHFVNNP